MTRDTMTSAKIHQIIQAAKLLLEEFESLESKIANQDRVIACYALEYKELVNAVEIDFDTTTHPERLALARKRTKP